MKPQNALPLMALLALCACTKNGTSASEPAATATTEKPVAMVNGTPVSRASYEAFVKNLAGKPSAQLTAEQRAQVLDMLVGYEALAQQAEKDGLDKQPETSSELQMMRMQILAQAGAEHYMKDKKPTDAEVKQEYDTQIAAMPKLEYHARHILVDSQEAAQQIIAELKKGAKFEDLAKKDSKDSTKSQGGDLGWAPPSRYAKPFADAMVALKKGETTQAPVQTQFGWHVIQLIDTRDIPVPAFDTVKDRVAKIVESKKMKAYQDELVKAAKVEKNL